ncbi:hypothetical protein F5J12DRAFT_782570 [Pisolithus orientalis]|uniref:uncharacterized protein n=1 Tax=Pisolithus orientalis TaxID=936130 RepID=UPI002224E12B|nr:uncharacterized protein F5J12DRAFT_782570 [Pisolithus orientalis]KAI6007526.1 hypothetical protein F5J12DRAFT_782570 [Pisolithus orientalis]
MSHPKTRSVIPVPSTPVPLTQHPPSPCLMHKKASLYHSHNTPLLCLILKKGMLSQFLVSLYDLQNTPLLCLILKRASLYDSQNKKKNTPSPYLILRKAHSIPVSLTKHPLAMSHPKKRLSIHISLLPHCISLAVSHPIRDGGTLWPCDQAGCRRVVCNKCVVVLEDCLEEVTQLPVTFRCVACHWKMTRFESPQPYFGFYLSGKPVLKHPLVVIGGFEHATTSEVAVSGVWMSPGEDSEAGVEAKPSDLGEEIGGAGMTPIATSSGAQDILDSGRAPSEDTPHESSPACHANGDRVKYLKSLCIMPRYQELVELVDGLPETEMHGNGDSFWKALYQLQSEKFASTQKGLTIVLGFGMLWRECKRAQDIESDDPEAANLGFLLGLGLDIHKGEDVMGAVGLVVARLQQNSGGSSIGLGAQETTGVSAGDSCPTQGGGMKESWNTRKDLRKRKRGGSGDVDQKMAKEGEEASKKSTRAHQPTKRALGLGL